MIATFLPLRSLTSSVDLVGTINCQPKLPIAALATILRHHALLASGGDQRGRIEDDVGGARSHAFERLGAAAVDRQLGLNAFLLEQFLPHGRLGDRRRPVGLGRQADANGFGGVRRAGEHGGGDERRQARDGDVIFMVDFLPVSVFVCRIFPDRQVAPFTSAMRGAASSTNSLVMPKCFDNARTAASASRLTTAATIALCSASTLRGLPTLPADREPAISLALLVQHVAEAEQPGRAAGIDQRTMEDAMTDHPLLVVHASDRRDSDRERPSDPPRRISPRRARHRRPARSSDGAQGPRYRSGSASRPRDRPSETGLTRKPRWSDACTSPSATSRDKRLANGGKADGKLLGEAGDMQLLARAAAASPGCRRAAVRATPMSGCADHPRGFRTYETEADPWPE